MKKRSSAARPILLRIPTHQISPLLLSRLGEALIIASLIVILFFHFWLGIVVLLVGGLLAANGYILAEPQRSVRLRTQINSARVRAPQVVTPLLKKLLALTPREGSKKRE